MTASTNERLAAEGWLEAADPAVLPTGRLKADKVLICRQPRCGGLGGISWGHGSASGSRTFETTLLKVEADPRYSAEWIKTAAIQYMPEALARYQAKYVDVHKVNGTITMMVTGQMAAAQGAIIHFVYRLWFSGLDVQIALGAGPSPNIALQRLAQAERLRSTTR
ncbi:hypothetical protein [Labrys monachus]|uniref:Uncharacterized protein n=1 Tax=Labrys monachus TaxID=217067 RepID=A0ABU0FPA6_9HYPH|nr:hypothetical protein [Labrys monachus]MDQ0396442.1 hypothetical protein [Labrys monachus]